MNKNGWMGMKKAIIVLISVLMFTSMMIVPGNTDYAEASVPEVTSSGLVPHAPIRINSNAGFTLANGVNNTATGDGSAGNPWVIENWDIDGTGFSYSIYVGNTTEHFVVRNCSFHDVGAPTSFPYFCNSGLLLYNVQNGTMDNNTALRNSYGMYLESSFNNTILNNNASDTGTGIWVNSSNDNYFDNNTFLNNEYGILLDYSINNTIANNTASNNWYGIFLVHSIGNNVTNNTVSSIGDGGIWQSLSSGNIITGNTISTSYYSILLMSSSNCTIYNNTMLNDGISIIADLLEHWNTHTIDTSNTVNGRPVHYWNNQTSGTVPIDAGQVILANCTNVIIENQNITNVRFAIALGFSDNNEIINNNVSLNSYAGIHLYASCNNTITNNNLSSNLGGIWLQSSSNNNLIYYNIFNNNSASDSSGNNSWDNGYPSGGNYWSDYTGTDIYYGPNQTTLGSDGIGDTNYTNIGGGKGAVDNYPLMEPFNGTMPQINDITPPNSTITSPLYWTNSPIETNATDDDNGSYVSNVTLHFRHSPDNVTFGPWTEFGLDDVLPWNWTFSFPDGEGYYQFYSIAVDNFNNAELAPATADAECAYDITAPQSEIFTPTSFWHNNRSIYLDWTANDTMSGFGPMNTSESFPSHDNVDLWMRYSAANQTWGAWSLAVENMWNGSIFNTSVLEDGWFQFYSIASDMANNTEQAPTTPEYDAYIGVDTAAPVAVAGSNRTINQGSQLIFNASGSTDNLEIAEYVWNFTYQTQSVVVSTQGFNFTFHHYGQYLITLTVTDYAGNTHSDTLLVTVQDTESPIADAGKDQQTDPNVWITFDGSGSTDNVGIVNYTWTFVYNGSQVTLYGPYPKFRFAQHDTYNVTLMVRDEAGNSDTDTVEIYVEESISPGGGGSSWVIVIFILVLIITVAGILAFYFRKESPPRDPDGRRVRDDDDYESGRDDRYDRDQDDRY